jgi:hypothetical protein
MEQRPKPTTGQLETFIKCLSAAIQLAQRAAAPKSKEFLPKSFETFKKTIFSFQNLSAPPYVSRENLIHGMCKE